MSGRRASQPKHRRKGLTSASSLTAARGLILFWIGVLIVTYTRIPVTDSLMLLLGFPLGFFLNGIFAGMGAYLSELFPNRVRDSGQGFCYNVGRAVGSICPALVGYVSDTMPLGITLWYIAAGAYLLVILSVLTLPETQGRELTVAIDPVPSM